MSNNPQMLGQATRARSIKPARAKGPAGSPIMVNERPHLSSAFRRIGARRDTGGIIKNVKAPKTKTDDKKSLSWDMFKELDDAEVDDFNLGWNKMTPADQIAEVKAGDENKQLEAYTPEPASEDARRRVSLDPYSASTPGLRPTRPLEVGHGFHLHSFDEPIAPHRGTYKLVDCGLRSTHYTISQDHTSGQEAHEDSLLASFGKRRRTNKPSVLLNGTRLLQRSANMLPSLANGDDAVAQNKGSGMQKMSQDDFDFLANLGYWKPISSKMPEDVSARVRERERQALSYLRRRERSRRAQSYLLRQDQQHQSPQAYISSVVNTNYPDDDVSRDRLRRGLHPLDPSPPPEVPPSIVRPKIRLTSGNAALVADRPDSVVYPRITRTTTRHSSSVNGFAAEEQ